MVAQRKKTKENEIDKNVKKERGRKAIRETKIETERQRIKLIERASRKDQQK